MSKKGVFERVFERDIMSMWPTGVMDIQYAGINPKGSLLFKVKFGYGPHAIGQSAIDKEDKGELMFFGNFNNPQLVISLEDFGMLPVETKALRNAKIDPLDICESLLTSNKAALYLRERDFIPEANNDR